MYWLGSSFFLAVELLQSIIRAARSFDVLLACGYINYLLTRSGIVSVFINNEDRLSFIAGVRFICLVVDGRVSVGVDLPELPGLKGISYGYDL